MTGFMQSLLTASLYGSVIIAVIVLLRLVLRKAPKKYICLLWLLAALRLLLPFQIESSLSLQPSAVQNLPARLEQNVDPRPQLPTVSNPGSEVEIPGATPGISIPVDPPAVSPPTVTVPVQPPVTVTEEHAADPMLIAGWIWAAVAVGLVMYSTVAYLRLRRRVSDAVILSEGVWITKLDTAMVLGFFKPQIYLNARLDETQRDLVLRHELCHIRRGDQLWKPLGFLTLAIHWFNPLVWLGYILLCRDLEMACDEAVIQNLDLSQRKSYSAALLSCSARHRTIAACPVAFGEVSVKERIKNVLNYKKPAFWIIMIAVIAVTVVAVCFLTSPATPDPEPEVSADWGITVLAKNATATSAIFRFLQSGAGVDAQYFYGNAFSLEIWNGVDWEAVPQLTEAVFTTEAYELKNNGLTNVYIDWEWLYGPLYPGSYRISKWVTDLSAHEDRRFDAYFQLDGSEGTGDASEPKKEMEYTVTLRYNGYPITENPGLMEAFRKTAEESGGIYAMWHDGTTLHTAPFDETGVARITGLDGDYRVNLSVTPGDYYYLVNDQWATYENPQITIDLYRVLYGDGPGTREFYPYIKRLDAPGLYEVTISGPEDTIYCRFVPEMAGTYLIESLVSIVEDNVNPMLVRFYDVPPYELIIDDGGQEGTYTKNFEEYYIFSQEEIENGRAITFGIRATAKDGQYPIKVFFQIVPISYD